MQPSYRFGRYEIRPSERQLLVDNEPQPIGTRAFDVLLTLVERRDRLVSKEELLENVWPGLVVEENNIQVQISGLRKLLGSQAIATVAGRGYRFTPAVEEPAENAADTGPLVAPTPHNLPRLRTRFIGRAAQRRQLAQLLEAHPLVTLTAIGGAGKTRLALRVAEDLLERYPGGVWYVDLAAEQESSEVAAAVLRVLQLKPAAGADEIEALARAFGRHRSLLILDNCEHLIDAVVILVEKLLAACDVLTVLATSREPLGVAGEQVVAVRPLQVTEPSKPAVSSPSDAVLLFVDRAQLIDPEFALTEDNADFVSDICRRLDGIPLAIELAAARVNVLSLEQIRSRLDDRFRLLTGGSPAVARHRTLGAVVQWSYETLSTQEKRLLQSLSVFVGGWNLEAAAAMATSGADEFDALDVLTRLSAKSLITSQREGREARYGMLETVRQYAYDQLCAEGDLGSARSRHRQHFLRVVRALPDHPDARRQAYERLAIERDNIVAAIRDCIAAGDLANGASFVARLSTQYWHTAWHTRLAYELASEVLACPQGPAPVPDLLEASCTRASLAYNIGAYPQALALATEARDLARTQGNPRCEAKAQTWLVAACTAMARYEDAWKALRDLQPVAERVGSSARLDAMHYEAELLRSEGRLEEAERLYERQLEERQREGNRRMASVTHANLALVALLRRNAGAAVAHLRSAVRDRESGYYAHEFLAFIAAAAACLGEFRRAAILSGADRYYCERSGFHLEPLDRSVVEPLLSEARAALGNEAFCEAEAWGASQAAAVVVDAVTWMEQSAAL